MKANELKAKLAACDTVEGKVSLLDSHAGDLIQKGRYREALRHYAQALELEKQPNARAYFTGQIGICYYNLGEDRKALAHLLRSARLFQTDKPEFMPDMYGFVHFHLGSLYEYHGQLAKSLEARRVCEQYADSQEKDTQWMLFAGMSRIYESMGKHDEAIRYSQKAIQVLSDNDPGLAYLYESMGSNYMSLGQYREAIKYLAKVTELDPGFERQDEIYLRIADCYQRLTNDKLALESYQKILELKQISGKRENLTWLYLKIAHSQFRLEQYEKSLLTTLEALRRRPKTRQELAEVRSLLTTNYFEMGRFLEAVREGEKTLRVARHFPNESVFYFRMALSYHKTGDKKAFAKYRALCKKNFPGDGWNKYLEKLTGLP